MDKPRPPILAESESGFRHPPKVGSWLHSGTAPGWDVLCLLGEGLQEDPLEAFAERGVSH